jgi:beta-aspartyl-peptidase (threonine type)
MRLDMDGPIIVVHGGAGAWPRFPERIAPALAACERAAAAGRAIVAAAGAALDAVEAAVRVLEDEPVLNAGRGSYANTAGEVEMDALLMDGADLRLGAVAAIQRVRNPVALARAVMDRTPHTLLVGNGASRFADEIGFPRCDVAELLAGRSAPVADTVGAVARDAAGNVAVAASTGGIPRKLPGRVGDTPLVGSGAYADNATCAVTATGDGEALMRITISRLVRDLVERGATPQEACDAAMIVLSARTGGQGGLIALDGHGRAGASFNSPAMPVAVAFADGRVASADTAEGVAGVLRP